MSKSAKEHTLENSFMTWNVASNRHDHTSATACLGIYQCVYSVLQPWQHGKMPFMGWMDIVAHPFKGMLFGDLKKKKRKERKRPRVEFRGKTSA